jgi:hypothetical protein
MTHDKLPADATLRTALPTLQNPEGHVRQILENMSRCRKEHGNAHVRIGVTGKGKVPYHQVFYTDDSGAEHIHGSYDGKSPFKASEDRSGWSSASMTRDEAMALIGEIRQAAR